MPAVIRAFEFGDPVPARVGAHHTRGLGLMAGLELRRPDGAPATEETIRIVKRMLCRGFILLPEGEHSNVISFTPPLTITAAQLKRAVHILAGELSVTGS